MAIVLNGTTGITNDSGYTGDGVSFADSTPANTLVTTSGGNVGIGTSSPSAKLTIAGGTANNYADGILMSKSGGNSYSVYPDANDLIVRSVTGATEVCRFTYSGNLLVGTTVNPGAGGYKMVVKHTGYDAMYVECGISPGGHAIFATRNADGDLIALARNGVIKGSISVNTTSVAYNTTSDYRLKEAVAPMTGALDRVSQLKPVTYTWKVDGSNGQGFIAHELAEVEPGCVTGEKDAVDADGNPVYQGIDTSFLVATLTAAIQEQQALIESLTARVVALDARLISLEGQAT